MAGAGVANVSDFVGVESEQATIKEINRTATNARKSPPAPVLLDLPIPLTIISGSSQTMSAKPTVKSPKPSTETRLTPNSTLWSGTLERVVTPARAGPVDNVNMRSHHIWITWRHFTIANPDSGSLTLYLNALSDLCMLCRAPLYVLCCSPVPGRQQGMADNGRKWQRFFPATTHLAKLAMTKAWDSKYDGPVQSCHRTYVSDRNRVSHSMIGCLKWVSIARQNKTYGIFPPLWPRFH